MAGKEDILKLLRGQGIWFEITEHKAVYHMGNKIEFVSI